MMFLMHMTNTSLTSSNSLSVEVICLISSLTIFSIWEEFNLVQILLIQVTAFPFTSEVISGFNYKNNPSMYLKKWVKYRFILKYFKNNLKNNILYIDILLHFRHIAIQFILENHFTNFMGSHKFEIVIVTLHTIFSDVFCEFSFVEISHFIWFLKWTFFNKNFKSIFYFYFFSKKLIKENCFFLQ